MLQVRSFGEWRAIARRFLQMGVRPGDVLWNSAENLQEALFPIEEATSELPGAPLIPKQFLRVAEEVSHHSDPVRWDLLYRVAWRLTHGERHLLEVDIDEDIAALQAMRRAVKKDMYRMRAFVRFRKVQSEDGERFVAWYEPDHHILESNALFFIERFGSMRWAILTPRASLMWNLKKLETGPGVPRRGAPPEDELEDLWRLYYRTIYNPARLNVGAMRPQLPVARWKDLPEARTIPELVRLSAGRVDQMLGANSVSATAFVPQRPDDVAALADAVRQCRGCGLCSRASQPVWGEGNPAARIMLVGEQPGDEEDRAGRPFVGPAGRVLDSALRDAGLSRPELYVTNAVKAFKFEERGKRRIHQTPRSSDISACRPWLRAELETIRPAVVVCLGASAAESVLGRKVRISAERGTVVSQRDARVVVTYHPSAVLRSPEAATQAMLFSNLVADLALAAAAATHAT